MASMLDRPAYNQTGNKLAPALKSKPKAAPAKAADADDPETVSALGQDGQAQTAQQGPRNEGDASNAYNTPGVDQVAAGALNNANEAERLLNQRVRGGQPLVAEKARIMGTQGTHHGVSMSQADFDSHDPTLDKPFNGFFKTAEGRAAATAAQVQGLPRMPFRGSTPQEIADFNAGAPGSATSNTAKLLATAGASGTGKPVQTPYGTASVRYAQQGETQGPLIGDQSNGPQHGAPIPAPTGVGPTPAMAHNDINSGVAGPVPSAPSIAASPTPVASAPTAPPSPSGAPWSTPSSLPVPVTASLPRQPSAPSGPNQPGPPVNPDYKPAAWQSAQPDAPTPPPAPGNERMWNNVKNFFTQQSQPSNFTPNYKNGAAVEERDQYGNTRPVGGGVLPVAGGDAIGAATSAPSFLTDRTAAAAKTLGLPRQNKQMATTSPNSDSFGG